MDDERGRELRRALQSVGMTAKSQWVAEMLDMASGLSDDDLAEFVRMVEARAAAHSLRVKRPADERLN